MKKGSKVSAAVLCLALLCAPLLSADEIARMLEAGATHDGAA